MINVVKKQRKRISQARLIQRQLYLLVSLTWGTVYLLRRIGYKYIPKEFFGQELREAAE